MTNMNNQIVDFEVKATPAQILKQVVPLVMRHGIELFELARISEQLKSLTAGTCDGRAIINSIAALDVQLNLIGSRLMPFAYGELPSIIIPAQFSDTTMQFHSYLDPVRRDTRPSYYFPTLDSESGITEMLVKQGVWLKNYNGNYTYALLQKKHVDLKQLDADGDLSGRTTMWIPVVRLDHEGPKKMTLLNCRASTLNEMEGPFSKLFARTTSSLSLIGPVLPVTDEMLGEVRKAVTEALPWYGAVLEFFNSANNSIPAEQAKTVRDLLVATANTNPSNVRYMLTLPNRSL